MTAPAFALLRWPDDQAAIAAAFARLTDAGGLYQSWEWFRQHAEAPPHPDFRELVVVEVSGRGRTVGVIPLQRTRTAIGPLPLWVLTPPWHIGAAAALPLAAGVAAWPVLTALFDFARRAIGGRWDALQVAKQLPGGALAGAPRWSARPLAHVRAAGTVRALDTAGSYDAHLATLTPKARAGLRLARNRLRRHAVTHRRVDAPPEALAAALDTLLDLEGTGWKQLDPARRAAMWPLVRDLAAREAAWVHLLEIDGAPAAALLELAGPASRRHAYKIGYDEGLAALSPGKVLMDRVIRSAFDDPAVTLLDFMSDAAWLSPWRPTEVPLTTATFFRRTPRGLLALALTAARALGGPTGR